MSEMVQDIIDAMIEARNITSTLISVNSSQTVLIGHSAGAHLCCMVAIELASSGPSGETKCADTQSGQTDYAKGDTEEFVLQQHGNGANYDQTSSSVFDISNNKLHVDEDKGSGCSERKYHGGDLRENQEELVKLMKSLKGVVGIGGVYHIMNHYNHEAKRGVEDISPMWKAAEGLENFEKYSPALTVRKLTEEQKKRLPPHVLIHGTKDKTVPPSSSILYATALSEEGVDHVQLKLLPDGGHAELVMDMMVPGRTWYSLMFGTIKESVSRFLKE